MLADQFAQRFFELRQAIFGRHSALISGLIATGGRL